MCQQRLNPGGIITQWVPLYETTIEAVKSEVATFFEALPYGTIWSNDYEGEGYDIVMLGTLSPTRIHMADLDSRLKQPEYAEVLKSLKTMRMHNALTLLSTYAGSRADLHMWLTGAQINRDRNLRLQYLAGMGLNRDETLQIFDDMIADVTFPEQIVIATDLQKTLLKNMLLQRTTHAPTR